MLVCSSLLGFSQDVMTPELLWELGRVGNVQVSPDQKTVLYSVTYYDVQENKGNGDLYTLNLETNKVTQITETPYSEFSATWRSNEKIAFLSAKSGSVQLYEMKADGSELTQVSDIEGGISTYNYSHNGEFLAFSKEVKIDETTADLYPELKKAEAVVIDDLMYRHWDHWSDAYYSHVFYAPIVDGKVSSEAKDIMEGERFDAPTQPFGGGEDITWSADDSKIVYVSKKKAGKEYAVSTDTELYFYDLETGKTEKFENGEKGYDTHPVFSTDGSRLAWLGMARDGYESDKNVLYVYDFKLGKKVAVTGNWDETVSSFIWGKDNRTFYFLAPVEATYQLFEVKLPKKIEKEEIAAEDIRMITKGEHNYGSLAVAGNKLIGLKQSMKAASEIYSVDIKSGEETKLTTVNDEIYNTIDNVTVEKRWVPTSDGKKMLVWVVLPPNFDENKKYPALLYCQGGPQSPVSQFYSFRWNFQLMASKGYVVIAPNRRGLPSFGTEWNEAISQDWGGQSMEDYLAAVDDVSKESYIDKDNIGAVGASYGGYSVYMLAGIHEGRFSAFISHCGLFNMESWYGTTEEMFFANWDLGAPYWEYPQHKTYTKFSPHRYVQNWDTPILVIHGGKDFRVPESEGMQAFQAAQLRGIPSKFLYFPNEGHWVLKPQNGLIWHSEYFKWLDKWLKSDQQ